MFLFSTDPPCVTYDTTAYTMLDFFVRIDKVTQGLPSLCKRDKFFNCQDCLSGKIIEQNKGYNMDYGFVRGKTKIKSEDGLLITSKDG